MILILYILEEYMFMGIDVRVIKFDEHFYRVTNRFERSKSVNVKTVERA